MSTQINVQREVLNKLETLLNQGNNNFLGSYLYQETQNEFIEEAQDPNNFWVINQLPYVPVSFQWIEGNIVALDSIYDESGLINIQWALYVDQDIISKLDDLDLFKRALRGLQGKLHAEEKKTSLGAKLEDSVLSSTLPDANTLEVGTYVKITGSLNDLDRIYEVKLEKEAQDDLTETHIWFNTYKTQQDYEYETLQLSLNSSSYNIDSQPYIMNSKRISIVSMQIPYRVHDGRNGSDNTFRIKPLTLTTDTRGDDDYIELIHITRSNSLGIDTSANQSLLNKEIGLSNTSTLYGSDFLLYDSENFLTDYLYNRIGRYKYNQEDLSEKDMITVSNPSQIFTLQLNVGGRIYTRDVVIDSIHYMDGIAERTMWSFSLKTAKPKLVQAQRAG